MASTRPVSLVAPAERVPIPMPDPVRTPGTQKVHRAVVFYAPASATYDEDGLATITPAWFFPVVCVDGRVIRYGNACAPLVPAVAKVAMTSGRELTLARGGGLANHEHDPNPVPRPFAPACCFYEGCQGKVTPFTPKGAPLLAMRPAIAVWPADADVGLEVPSLERTLTGEPENVHQSFEVRGQEYATTYGRLIGGALLHREPTGWVPVDLPGLKYSRAAAVLAVTDVDQDGKNELFVYGHWANDYAFALHVEGQATPPLHYNCGNI